MQIASLPPTLRRRYARLLGLLSGLALGAPATALAQMTPPAPDAGMTHLKQLSIEELMDLEVTSVSKRPERIIDAASAVEVITGEDIRRSGASSLPEALRLAPNLAVAQKGSHTWGISARGFNTDLANKLLVLVDGRAVYTPLYSGVFWERQDYLLPDVERIEVISGPGGALWGANAVNGVINITSKNARDTRGLLVETGAGNELRGFAGVRYGGELAPDIHYRVYGKYSERDGGRFTAGGDVADDWHATQAGFRIDATTAQQDTITVQGDVHDSDQGQISGDTMEVGGRNLLARWTRRLVNGSETRLQLYYDHTHLAGPAPALVINGITFAPKGFFSDDLDTYDLDFQHTLPTSGRHAVIWGFGYRFTHDVVRNAPSLGFLPPRLDQDLFNAFANDEIKLRDDLTFSLGTKVEHNDYTGLEWEPSARLHWKVREDQTLWAAVSRAVRMPSRIDRDLTQGTPPNFVLLAGGRNFRSETVVAYELGYRGRLGPQLTGAVSLFYNRYDDVRSTSATPATVFPFFLDNNLEGETHGLEASFVYHATPWWRWQGGFNLLRENLRVKPGRRDINNALNELADPEHQLSLRTALDLGRDWELDVAWRWVDDLIVNNGGQPNRVPDYSELNVRLGWSPHPAIDVSLVGQNLLADHHAEFSVPQQPREEIQRSLYARLTWRY